MITTFAAATLTQNLIAGGILILLGGFFDMLDGVIARVNNRATDFGAFLDSVLDRYSDAFLLLSFSWYFSKNGSIIGLFLSVGTMIGALIISYAKARAEGLGKNCHTGLMERPDRIILMVFGAFTGWVLPVMWLMLILTHVTVVQRILHVRKVMR
jgi:phosphatidylglycerophosphate synthase